MDKAILLRDAILKLKLPPGWNPHASISESNAITLSLLSPGKEWFHHTFPPHMEYSATLKWLTYTSSHGKPPATETFVPISRQTEVNRTFKPQKRRKHRQPKTAH